VKSFRNELSTDSHFSAHAGIHSIYFDKPAISTFTRAIMRMIMITRQLRIPLAGRTRIITRRIESERSNFRRKVLSFFTLLVFRSFLLLVEANCCLDRYRVLPSDKKKGRRDKFVPLTLKELEIIPLGSISEREELMLFLPTLSTFQFTCH